MISKFLRWSVSDNIVTVTRLVTWLSAGLMVLAVGFFLWGAASAEPYMVPNDCRTEEYGSWSCGTYIGPSTPFVDPLPKALRAAKDICDFRRPIIRAAPGYHSWWFYDTKHYLPGCLAVQRLTVE